MRGEEMIETRTSILWENKAEEEKQLERKGAGRSEKRCGLDEEKAQCFWQRMRSQEQVYYLLSVAAHWVGSTELYYTDITGWPEIALIYGLAGV